MAPGTVRPCAHCGNKFVPMNSKDSKFCSMACFTTWRRAKTAKKKCEGCGSEFEVWQRHADDRKYCSHSCFMSSQKIYEGTAECSGCGVRFTPIRWRKLVKGFSYTVRRKDTFVCSVECLNKVRVNAIRKSAELRAALNPRPERINRKCTPENSSYRGVNWDRIAESIRARDNYKCQRCGMTQQEQFKKYRKRLNVHHIIPYHNFTNARKANRRSNLTTLCAPCHRKVEWEVPEVQLTFCFSDAKKNNRTGFVYGSRHFMAKFSERDVVDLRRRYRNGESVANLADEFGVSHTSMGAMISGKTWKMVPNPVPLSRSRKSPRKRTANV